VAATVSRSREGALFDLALYQVSCARLVFEENLGLASFRLLEGASRLLSSADELGLELDPFLVEQLQAIEAEKLHVMHDVPRYIAALERIQAAFVAEATRRNEALESAR
jgi:hypothetical protein